MRVNTRVVIDIESGIILTRQSYEYDGKLALAEPISTFFAGIGTALGASTATATATGVAAVGTAVSTVGTIASLAMKSGAPKMPRTTPAPTVDQTSQAQAEMRRRQAQSRGYQSNILSDLSSTYGGGGTGGLKTLTGA